METLAVSCIVLLKYSCAGDQVFFVSHDILEIARTHVCLETVGYFHLSVSLEVHEHRVVKVNHRFIITSHGVHHLEALDMFTVLLSFERVAVDNVYVSRINYDLSGEILLCLLIFDDNLVLAGFNITSEHEYVVRTLILSYLDFSLTQLFPSGELF